MRWGEYLFGFRGRLNRKPYWAFLLVAFLFLLVMAAIAVPFILIEHPSTSDTNRSLSLLGIATLVAESAIIIVYFVAATAIVVKRLHDRDKSGWWIVPFIILPNLVARIIDPAYGLVREIPVAFVLGAGLLSLVLALWGFVEMGLLRGTEGENRYGPDPLASISG